MTEAIYAGSLDFEYLKENDRHIKASVLGNKIKVKEVIVLKENGRQIGWLRYGLFWDTIPFMNMLYIEESYRRRGLGQQLVLFWEDEMKKHGYTIVMTSSFSNEEAQHFYRKIGYKDSGSLLLPNEPLEIFFTKHL
jgi:GNAT superfamily N-acetyltransferase